VLVPAGALIGLAGHGLHLYATSVRTVPRKDLEATLEKRRRSKNGGETRALHGEMSAFAVTEQDGDLLFRRVVLPLLLHVSFPLLYEENAFSISNWTEHPRLV